MYPIYLLDAGAGAAGGAPPADCASVFPSGSVTETKRPPGSPLLSGVATTFTLSPNLSEVDFQPARTRNAGDVISRLHRSTPPFALGTSRSSQECGLPHLNCLTVPSRVTDFPRSTPG